MWVEKKSIDEIATIRVLTKQTIYSHFVSCKTKAVAISEVLPADKMQDLAAAFDREESLNGLMEKHGQKNLLGRSQNVQSEFELIKESLTTKKPY
jgi:uncharacterized protein YpbB